MPNGEEGKYSLFIMASTYSARFASSIGNAMSVSLPANPCCLLFASPLAITWKL